MLYPIYYLHNFNFSLLRFGGQPGLVQVRPPNYSPDQLPETSFTCEDKVQ